nr:probably inactive leucine-rich repeat receptor-like protein kinase At5g06940 [Tanacetum cinerariifolium]
MEKGSLGDLINKGDFQLAWNFHLKISIGIAQGLAYLHKDYVTYLLHRDVKSRNVLLDNEFEPKLTDLALDTILSENAFQSSLDSKLGSSCFISPEKRPSMWEVVEALQSLGSKTRVLKNGVKTNLICERIQISIREI